MRPRHRCPCAWIVLLLATAKMLAAAKLACAVTIGAPALIGTITSASLPEVSGIVDSRANANTFWVHNDSGNPSEFFAINHRAHCWARFLSRAPRPATGKTSL